MQSLFCVNYTDSSGEDKAANAKAVVENAWSLKETAKKPVWLERSKLKCQDEVMWETGGPHHVGPSKPLCI